MKKPSSPYSGKESRIDGGGKQKQDVSGEITPAAIEERIKQVRTGTISVKTAPGVEVIVEQQRHAFQFGTAVPNGVAEQAEDAFSDADRKLYLRLLGENFNYAVHENALKWYDCEKTEGDVDYSVADRIWERCHELDIPMRGHCIFWEKAKLCMDWLKPLTGAQLRSAIVRRGLGVTGHFRNRINEYDLNNEMINGEFFRNRLGFGVISEMAWIAKAGNPDAVLYVNDYGILLEGGFNFESYMDQIGDLLANGIPIGGIGCQGHSGTLLQARISPEHVQRSLNALGKFNLPIKITECLFDVGDARVQAEEMERILPLYFAHPAVEAVLMWGAWAGSHWKPWAAMWDKDWKILPQGAVYRDLVFKRWWTKVSGSADKKGEFRTEAFYGDYLVTVNGKSRKIVHKKAGGATEVTFT